MKPSVYIILAILATTASAAPQQQRLRLQQQQQEQSGEVQSEATTAATARKPAAAAAAETEDQRPAEIPRPAASSTSRPVETKPEAESGDASSDVRREEHKKIVPFQFHRVCRELDLKRPNCSCVWESTFQVSNLGLKALIDSRYLALSLTLSYITHSFPNEGYQGWKKFNMVRVTGM